MTSGKLVQVSYQRWVSVPEIGLARDWKIEISEKFDEFSWICRQGLILAPIQTLLYLHSHEHFVFLYFLVYFSNKNWSRL